MENQLRQITKEELDNILEQHKLWLETRFSDEAEGQCADLRYADFSHANLSGADFSCADLSCANLSGADFSHADLSGANLSGANFRDADLRGANFRDTDLSCANFRYANLNGVNLDFSCFPLWCGGLNVHIDDKQAIQLLYHLIRNVQFSKNTSDELKALLLQPQIIEKANEFHRVSECGKIELKEEVEQ